MAQAEQLRFRADESLRDDVEAFQEEYGHDTRSDALRDLVEVGLREQRSPILWRFKDRVVEWINLLSISAVVIFVVGAATGIYGAGEGTVAAFVMLTLATVLLAVFEFARVVAGMNEMGVRARHAAAAVVSRHE